MFSPHVTESVKCYLPYHGEIDIAGIKLHVDLLVDEGLTLLVVVLPDLGSHADGIENLSEDKFWWSGVVLPVCSTLSGVAIEQAVSFRVGWLLRRLHVGPMSTPCTVPTPSVERFKNQYVIHLLN